MQQRLTKRQRRLQEKGLSKSPVVHLNMNLKEIYPMTDAQEQCFREYEGGQHLFMLGAAGSGKSLVALYLALREVFGGKSKRTKVVIIRSAQSSKQIGFLPGTAAEKIAVYESAYRDLCSFLFGRGDAYEVLKQKGVIEFTSTSFLRGLTIDNAVIILEEIQNNGYGESLTCLTRTGDSSRIIINGDTKQDDLTSKRYNEESGIQRLIRVCRQIPSMSMVSFGLNDIVRGGFVREFLIADHNVPT